ncbi:molybdate ABC transporter substrate-binding protein [Mannheimia bovis]|uniref:molybdate ABC transporter substrate-binding protein n=1 Tax=Mannheimia bovis TaxID=2770636 RepID=UPI0024B74AAE|nr:molybdate ABC transporter substrate-binding protein [Mannheimia bovis]WHP46825.1 molybdate ABC transporter substrate-binding protein [Mannheimia bovis]
MKILKKLTIAMALTLSGTAFSQDITVFAAASMTNVLQDIGKDFEQKYPEDKLIFSFASSSVLAKQIEQDAPADLFISADQKWMDYVAEKQSPKIKHRQNLVKNELVLIAPNESKIQAESIQAVDFSKELANSYLSVGDPDHVPAGKYAKKALSHYKLWESVEPRLARAKNVRDALSFVERGESPLGIVYSTDAKVSQKVKVLAVFPSESYGEIVYPAAAIGENAAAVKFLAFLKTEQAKAKFEQAGFYPIQ